MATKTLKKAKWLWQDYTGATWNNLAWGNTGDNHATYSYPQGKNSTSAYRPKSLFYHYQVTGIASSQKINSVKFVLVIGKFNINHNNLPSVKVFSGDGNAPYNKSPITTVKTPKKLSNVLDNDSYTLEYDITGATISQLKNIIVEVDWSKTKIKGASTISINRARLTVTYGTKNPKWSVYSSASNTVTQNGTINWKITAKNTGETSTNSVCFTIPKGITIVSTSKTGGTYDSTNKKWTISGAKNKSYTFTFKLKFTNVGIKELVASNCGIGSNSSKATSIVSCIKKETTTQSISADYVEPPEDIVTYTFYDCYEGEYDSYFDVNICGFKENHPYGIACITLDSSPNIEFITPLRSNVQLIDSQTNVKEIITSSQATYDNGNITIDVEDDTVCLVLNDINQNFMANLRVYIRCLDDTEGTIYTIINGNSTEGSFDILEERRKEINIIPAMGWDISHVQQSVNIGSPEVWTINLQSSKTNFFEEKQSDFAITIEDLIAYIGCVPLSRGHKADLKADTKNSLIDTNYLNRRYLGKKGDYKENIPMTLRIPKQDVATLQGLSKMDKPIPIDTCPELLDGDPLNHRGWAEIYDVDNIHKINDMLYECDVGVAYLTHELLTKFTVNKGDSINKTSLKYYLQETHKMGDNIGDIFNLNYSQLFWNEENTNGDLVGFYELPPVSNLKFRSKEPLNDYCDYNIVFSNTLPQFKSEDYDNNWEMAIRLRETDNDNIIFEHFYNNFKHYDFGNDMVVNQCDITTYRLDENETSVIEHHDIHRLLMNAYNENEGKIITYFNNIGDITFEDYETDSIEIYLLDNSNNQLPNKEIEVKISSEDSTYNEIFYSITDIFGRAEFPVRLNNGTYTISFKFRGDDRYRSCEYSVNMTVNYDEVKYHFEYDGTSVVNSIDDTYVVTLLDENNDAVEGYSVQYAFRDMGNNRYSGELTLVTDENGEVEIPLNLDNGTKLLKVMFKGFEDNGVVHQPCFFEDIINFNIVSGKRTQIEADDIEFMQGENRHEYFVTLKDENGNLLKSKEIIFNFNNVNEFYSLSATTDAYGVASVSLYLNKGNWNVNAWFMGDDTYNPCNANHRILVTNFIQKDTVIRSLEGTRFNEDDIKAGTQNYPRYILETSEGIPIPYKFIRFKVYAFGNLVVDTTSITDENGIVELQYLTHDKNVVVDIIFEETAKYKESILREILIFEAIEETEEVGIAIVNNEVSITANGNPLPTSHYSVWISNDDNVYSYSPFEEDIAHMNIGTFNVTVHYVGEGNFCSQTKTIQITSDTDTRAEGWIDNPYQHQISISTNISQISYGSDGKAKYKQPVINHNATMLYANETYLMECTITNEEILNNYAIVKCGDYMTPVVIENKQFKTDFLLGASSVDVIFPPTDFRQTVVGKRTLYNTMGASIVQSSKSDSSVNGATSLSGETYQIFDLSANAPSFEGDFTDEIFKVISMKCVDVNCGEELYFNSLLNDSSTVMHIETLLKKDTWINNIIGYGNNTYKNYNYISITENDYAISGYTVIDTDSEILPSPDTTGDLDFSEISVIPSSTDGSIFGSNIYLKLRGNELSLYDYGMVKDADSSGGDIILENLKLPVTSYTLELEIIYKNTNYDRLNSLNGNLQMNIYEDTLNSTGAKEYGELIVSPMPLQEGVTKFTRYTDEGTMYYVKVKDSDSKSYICNPFVQYKGGTEMTSIDGISIFDLDNAFSPVFVNNGLVGVEFHRRSGYIRLSRYDERTNQWYYCNTLKLGNSPKLKLEDNYTDDYIEIHFGETVWKMWRGRPWIQLNHKGIDLRFLKLVDHVYCETEANMFEMGFMEEEGDLYSVFDTNISIQKFPESYHVGENITEENFKLYEVSDTNKLYDNNYDVDMEVVNWNSIRSLHVKKNQSCQIGVNFSSNPQLVKKPSDKFTLLISNIRAIGTNGTIKVKCRGFDDKGVVPCVESVQYGLWEETITKSISTDNSTDSIRVTFDDVPREVKYLDFTLILPTTINEIKMNNIMLYEGDSIIEHEKDESVKTAKNMMVSFDETYYACLYNENEPYGLAIFRMGQDSFTLHKLLGHSSNGETILVPYMKIAKEHDNIANIFLEYLNSNEQIINIDMGE